MAAHDFFFLRHGETTWNAARRTQGQLDTPLNETGRAQAAAAAALLKTHPIRRIVSSPLSRARDTAMATAAALDLEVAFDEGLMEAHLGAAQGGSNQGWLEDYWRGTITPEGAETFADFARRADAAVARAVDGANVLVVAHGGIWKALMAHRKIEPAFWMPNGAPIRVEVGQTAWRAEPLAPLPEGALDPAAAEVGSL